MKIYFVRHGQSEANLMKVHSGWNQVALTELGISQAKRVGEKLQKIEFDKIYSSDLLRAMQTAENALPGRSYETESLVREISVGELAGRSRSACYEEYGESYLQNRAAWDFTPYGGESKDMVYERAEKFLKKMETSAHECAAVFTHEGFVRSIISVCLGVRLSTKQIGLGNCSVVMLEYIDGVWKVVILNSELEK